MRAQMNLPFNYLLLISGLEALLYVMLAVFSTVSVYDVYGYLMQGVYQKAAISAGLACGFLRLFLSIPEFKRQLLDPKVTVFQFLCFCIKLLPPSMLKALNK